MTDDDQSPATKGDLKRFATKKDLEAVRRDLKQLKVHTDGRFDDLHRTMNQKFEEMNREFKVVAENLYQDFLDAFSDRTSLHQDKIKEHGKRIKRLEEVVGV